MGKIELRQELGRCFLTICYEKEETQDYLISMITENSIPGLLSCRVSYEGSSKILFYDVTNKLSLKDVYQNKNISLKELYDIFCYLSKTLAECRKYFLDEKYLIMNAEYIFFDPIADEYMALYIPNYLNENCNGRYMDLAEFLLDKVDQNDMAAVKITYSFYRMTKIDTFSPEAFKDVIEKELIMADAKEEDVKQEENQQEYSDNHIENAANETVILAEPKYMLICLAMAISLGVVYYLVKERFLYATYILLATILVLALMTYFLIKYVLAKIEQKRDQELENDFKDISVDNYWSDNEETQVFDDRTQVFSDEKEVFTIEKEYSLSWRENSTEKKYRILSFPVVIGKMASEVDCMVQEKSVSRIHARIERKNNRLYILDLNSTNGTFINGVKLNAGEEMEISNETSILIGNVNMRLI